MTTLDRIRLAAASPHVGVLAITMFDDEIGFTIFGRVHGFLFLIYIATALLCLVQYKWSMRRTLIVVADAIPPFVGFYVVHSLIKETEVEHRTSPLAS